MANLVLPADTLQASRSSTGRGAPSLRMCCSALGTKAFLFSP